VSACFVTGTGTGTGKTYVTAGILRALPGARAIKPVISGYDPAQAAESDSGILLAAMGRPITPETIAAISPLRFAAPLSPDTAALREGRQIEFSEIMSFCRTAMRSTQGLLLIEGAGGAMVPLDGQHTMRDWIAALQIPALLVAGTYLGTISHVLTTAEALVNKGINIAAIVLSESEVSPMPPQETAETITRFVLDTPVLIIPRHGNHAAFQQLAALIDVPA
jgi:dethiobiotin synthetase